MINAPQKLIKLYIIEEQELYREMYKSVLASQSPFELVHVSAREDIKTTNRAIRDLRPDVLLHSTKRLDEAVVCELEQVRLAFPQLGVVLLLVFHRAQDSEPLRRLATSGEGGMAILLKQSLDDIHQLAGIIVAVTQGQVILDPMLTSLLLSSKPVYPFLKQLTTRELEILSLLAKGYTNSAMAQSLFIDLKTVEHHINSMYSKLKTVTDFHEKHPRVKAARLYLEATGELPRSHGRITHHSDRAE